MINASVVLLACDSNISKNESLKACVKSLILQSGPAFEVILVDNSSVLHEGFIKEVGAMVYDSSRYKQGLIQYEYYKPDKQVSRGEARNRGVAMARSKLIIFLEDDTVLAQSDNISKIIDYSKLYRHGYGAIRDWFSSTWTKNNMDLLVQVDSDEFFRQFSVNSISFQESERRRTGNIYGGRTFIGNFGYCYKRDFTKVGGFPDFDTYGYEDDQLMYKIYLLSGEPKILSDLRVFHYDHPSSEPDRASLIKHFKFMNEKGHYWFHPIKLIEGENVIKPEGILEPLGSLHYDVEIEKAYNSYRESLPLDLETERNIKVIASWRLNQSYGLAEFARQIDILTKSMTIDDYIKKSHSDFDNLAGVVGAALANKIITVGRDGKVKASKTFRFTENEVEALNVKITPKSEYNQFPCDAMSVKRRYDLLKSRYPYAEYLRLGIIGDDDLLSYVIKDAFWIDAEIIEKDPDVIRSIKQTSTRFNIIKHDILSLAKPKNFKPVVTFITDPPYTKDGILAFILTGVYMLERSDNYKEFYVIVNPTMIGRHLDDVIKILSECGIYLNSLVEDFSQYKLPTMYDESKRAKAFVECAGLSAEAIQYSSSSNLYIFRTIHPNFKKLRNNIDSNNLYLHYPVVSINQ